MLFCEAFLVNYLYMLLYSCIGLRCKVLKKIFLWWVPVKRSLKNTLLNRVGKDLGRKENVIKDLKM